MVSEKGTRSKINCFDSEEFSFVRSESVGNLSNLPQFEKRIVMYTKSCKPLCQFCGYPRV